MKLYVPFAVSVIAALVSAVSAAAQSPARWWMDEPIRFLQTNLRETDSAVDPSRLVKQVAAYGANVYLCNMGGIVAQYPTDVEFHYRSKFLPPGRDLFGEVLTEAHAQAHNLPPPPARSAGEARGTYTHGGRHLDQRRVGD